MYARKYSCYITVPPTHVTKKCTYVNVPKTRAQFQLIELNYRSHWGKCILHADDLEIDQSGQIT